MIFQIAFQNGGYFVTPLKTFYVCKFLKDIITLLSMEVIWFQLPVQKYYTSLEDFKFLGSSFGTLFSYRWFLLSFSYSWQGNSKSNGGRISLIWLLSKFLISVSGYLQKILIQNLSLQVPHDAILLFRTSFPFDKEFKRHIKLLKKKASKTLSQFFDFCSNKNTAFSIFLGDVNEDMCYDIPYISLD